MSCENEHEHTAGLQPMGTERSTDAALLTSSKLRWHADDTRDMAERATPETFGNTRLASALRDLLGELSGRMHEQADGLEAATRIEIAEQQRRQRENEAGDHDQ